MKQATRRQFLKATGAAAGLVMWPGALGREVEAARSDSSRPNVLFVLADQWRAQALHCAGDPNIKTPHIDELARRGVRFTHCYSNSPLCTPFRSMLMSGRYTARTGVWKNNILLPPDELCIAESFGQAGYRTGYIGKWHLDGAAKPGSVRHRQGWRYWAGFNRGHNYFEGVYFRDADTKVEVPEGVFEPDHQTDLAINFITERSGDDAPWFLMLAFGGPHQPYKAPDQYMEMYNPDTLKLRPNVSKMKKSERKALAGYYAHATNLDHNIGRLVAHLKEQGLTEETLVVFTADHGDMHRSQGERFKSKPWEESIAVPMVAAWPGMIPRGREEDALFASIDIYPTLCGLCGVEIPEDKDGCDFSHLFLGKAGPRRDDVHLTIGSPEMDEAWRGVRTDRYTYAWYAKRDQGYVLYDNKKDPYQKKNLNDEPAHRKLQEKLHTLTMRNLKAIGDPSTPDRK